MRNRVEYILGGMTILQGLLVWVAWNGEKWAFLILVLLLFLQEMVLILLLITINEQISNFAQSYPANSITASIEAPLLINRYRFVSCSCFSCFCKKA